MKNYEENSHYQELIVAWQIYKDLEKEYNAKRIETENKLLDIVKNDLNTRGTTNLPLGLKIVTGETESWDQAELATLLTKYEAEGVDLPCFPFKRQLKPDNKQIIALLADVKYKDTYIKFVANAVTVKPKKAAFSVTNKK